MAALIISNAAGATVTDLGGGSYRLQKTSGADGWDASAVSAAAASASFQIKAVPGATGNQAVIGFSANPTANNSYTVDWALYFAGGTTLNVFASGNTQYTGTYAAGDVFWIIRQGTTVTFRAGSDPTTATVLYTVASAVSGDRYFDSSLFSTSSSDVTVQMYAADPIAPANGGNTQAATSPTLSARSAVTPANGAQSQTAGSPTLTARSSVAPASAAQAQAAASPTLGAKSTVAPADGAQAQAAGSPAIAAKSSIVAQNGAATQAAGSPSLAAGGSVQPNSSGQAQASSSPALTARSAVTPQSAASDQTASVPGLGAASIVLPGNGSFDQAATQPSLSARSSVAPQSAASAQVAGSAGLAARSAIVPSNAASGHYASSPIALVRAKLLAPLVQDGYSVTFPAQVEAHQVAGGEARYRQSTLVARPKATVQWVVDKGGYDYIRAFYRSVARFGAAPFAIDLVVQRGAMEEYEAIILPGSFQLSRIQGDAFLVGAQLEVKTMPDNSDADAATILAYELYGDEAAAVFASLADLVNVRMPEAFG